MSYLVSDTSALRSGTIRALRAVLRLCSALDDCGARLMSQITRAKFQTGIVADSSYASHVSAIAVAASVHLQITLP